MSLGIDFWKDFNGFWMPKWGLNYSQMDSKFDMDRQTQIFRNWSFHCRIYSRIWLQGCWEGGFLGSKINEKSIPKWCRTGKASGHRFLSDFGGFWEPKWGPKSVKKLSENGPKKGSRILVPLGPSWRHLGGVLGLKNPRHALVPLVPLTVVGSQGPLLRIP